MKRVIRNPLILIAAITIVFVVDFVLPINLLGFGIRPRSLFGLTGIIFSPFLHSNFAHLAANFIPLLVLSILVSMLNPARFVQRTVLLILLSGGLTWLISSAGIVVGASGLVFAYWAFLITHGLVKKRFKEVLIAIITIFIYGALALTLFKFEQGVSWAGHISGVIAGVLLAIKEK